MRFDDILTDYAEEPLNRQIILSLIKGYKRPNDKIGELMKSGELTSIKNGLYIPGPNSKIARPEPYLIANHLWGPSYISMETALSYWGFIPERAYEITSVTIKASRKYKTDAGRYTFRHCPLPYYSYGIKGVQLSPKQNILMASPEKAICDKIVMTSGIQLRSITQAIRLLTEDLRIDEDKLTGLDLTMMSTWLDAAPKRSSLKMLIKALQSL
ncbi:MAG: type IV toxin-antitoxin system AbiEi family antitoxin domain-containing protein [Mucilaginibacter sp.]